MSHYAKIEDNIVVDVIVATSDVAGTLEGTWIQTSYNNNIRKNFAGLGHTYDSVRDAFVSPKPSPSWVLDEDTCIWEAPVAMPVDDQVYHWDESTTAWVLDA